MAKNNEKKEQNIEEKLDQVQLEQAVETKTEAPKEPMTEREMAKAEKTMKQILESEEKVPLLIPVDKLNPNDVVPVGINGVIYAIPTGKEFMVPKSIAAVWRSSYTETIKADEKASRLMTKELEIY